MESLKQKQKIEKFGLVILMPIIVHGVVIMQIAMEQYKKELGDHEISLNDGMGTRIVLEEIKCLTLILHWFHHILRLFR